MTTSTHRYHGYQLVLDHENDDRCRVTIFDPRGNRVASTSTHLERQGAVTEASRYVNQLLAKRRAKWGVRTAQVRNQPARDAMAFKPNYGRDRADRARAARTRSEEKKRKRDEKTALRKAQRAEVEPPKDETNPREEKQS